MTTSFLRVKFLILHIKVGELNSKSFPADKTPEKRYEKELLFRFHSCLLKAHGCETALEHTALGFKACPDDFSEMIYCGALFCPGRPRFVLLRLYHSSAAAINPPCLLLPIQRHIIPSALLREPRDERAESLLRIAVTEGRRGRLVCPGAGAHLHAVGSGKRDQGCGGRGLQAV